MKILLVVPKFAQRGHYYIFPLGIAYISAALKRAGHTVQCLNLNHRSKDVHGEVAQAVADFDPDVVGTGALSVHFALVEPIFQAARQVKPHALLMLGGGGLSSQPEDIMRGLDIDIGVIGEGEETVVELMRALESGADMNGIAGIIFRTAEGGLIRTLERKTVRDLDQLPWPDYEGMDFVRHLDSQKITDDYFFNIDDRPRAASIISSRSCPYACTFCFHPLGRVYRERSLDDVFKEIDHLIETYQINMLAILDELFVVKRDRLVDFCRRIEPYGIKWMVQLRVDNVDEDVLRLMKQAGCIYVSYGLESMSQVVLDSMKKKCRPERADAALDLTYRMRIGIQGNFIFGDPAETLETATRTLDWWANNRRYQAFLTPVQCYPGTGIYEQARARGLIDNPIQFLKDGCPPLNLTALEQHVWQALITLIQRINDTFTFPGRLISVDREDEIDPDRGQLMRLACICPHCGQETRFGRVPFDKLPFGRSTMRLTCRNCMQRFDMPHSRVRTRFGEPVDSIFRKAEALRATGQVSAAAPLYVDIVHRIREHAGAWAGAAWSMLAMRRLDDAMRCGENALVLTPTDGTCHQVYAAVLVAQGQVWQARMFLRQALTLTPDNLQAKQALEALGPSDAGSGGLCLARVEGNLAAG